MVPRELSDPVPSGTGFLLSREWRGRRFRGGANILEEGLDVTTSSILANQRHLDEVLKRYFPGSFRPQNHGRSAYGQTLNGSGVVAEFLKFVGVEIVFGIPGGASLPLNDALTHAHVDGAFRYILTGHEQGAAFEAEGYAAASGKIGVCTATSGPGATNLVTGLADAFRDSRPVLALTGNTATSAEPEAFQAIDIVGITDGKATKASFRPLRADEVQETVVRAYHIAMTSRPGSVLIDLPKDVQTGPTMLRPWEDVIAQYDWSVPTGEPELIRQAVELLQTAERPVLYVGNGAMISAAAAEVQALARDYQIPVATTVHALGVLPADDPLNLGMIGMHGTIVANLAAHRSDVLVALGARFDDRVAGANPALFAPGSKTVHVEVDPYQLNRVRTVDVAIHGDLKVVLRQILRLLEEGAVRPPLRARQAWLAELAMIRQAMPIVSYDRPESESLSHEHIYATIADVIREREIPDVVATFDVGTHQMKGAQWFPISQPRSFVTSGGMGSMGCAMPMAVGAAMARPEATVIASVGDGGFVMSSHELDTIGGYGMPVKIVLFDDAHLGMVTNWHCLFFAGRKLTSDRRRDRERKFIDLEHMKNLMREALDEVQNEDDLASLLSGATLRLAGDEWPAFAVAAAAYGIPAERVHTKSQLRPAVERMLAAEGPYLLHIELEDQAQVYPLIPPGATPQDLIWRETAPGSGEVVRVRDRFDFETGRLRE